MKHLLALWLLLLLALPGAAHDPKISSISLRFTGTMLQGTLTIPTARWEKTSAAALLARLPLRADQQPLALRCICTAPSPDRQSVLIQVEGNLPTTTATVQLTGDLFPDDPQSQTLFAAYRDGKLLSQALLDRHQPTVVIALSAPAPQRLSALRFLWEGLHHIAIGTDHILFVVALLLLGGSLRQLLKIVTAFTLAHSVTLACAALGWWRPSGSVIEPLIALSIVCVGAENLLTQPGERDLRALLAFGFGFIHGFGFAGPLVDAALPPADLALGLFTFNLGVEVGQGLIVVTLAPLLALLGSTQPPLARRVCALGSVAIALCGVLWFVQRVMS